MKRFNTPDCESGTHGFEPRYPPHYDCYVRYLLVSNFLLYLKQRFSLLYKIIFVVIYGKIILTRISMSKIGSFFDFLVSNENKLDEKNWYKSFYKTFYIFMNVGCLICGFIPSFISFGRIFYIEDTIFFLVFYVLFLSFFLIDSFVFLFLSIKFHIFNKSWYVFPIFLIYLVFLILLSLNAYFFTDFNLTKTGYEVPFNPIMYIIDFVVILPLYGIYDYFLIKFFYNKI